LFVAILNSFVRDFLLGHHDLFVKRLLVLFPLFFELLQLIIDFTDFCLQDSHVLAREFVYLSKHIFLFLHSFLLGLKVFSQVLLLFLEFVLLVLQAFCLNLTLAYVSFQRVENSHHFFDLCFLFFDQFLQVIAQFLLHFVEG